MNYSILIVDDEKNIREGIQAFLEDEEYEITIAENGKEAIALLKDIEIDLVITDLKMSPINGEQLLQHIVTRYPTIPVIVQTGHGSIEGAVEAIRKGAYDFLTKPVNLDRMLMLCKRALQSRVLILENRRIRDALEKQNTGNEISAKSHIMQKILEKTNLVAPSTSTVLITGESGVGKEVLCNYIHKLSPRRDAPFVIVHCAALSESLLESELFGHEKGAFTGAFSQKKGRFELAHDGTIFLDEIGEINANMQVKLLRVLQEQSFERVGGERTLKVDVRIIAATNKDLSKEIQAGKFREDLYYRLSVVNIEVPPLRERKEDIITLAQKFLYQLGKANKKTALQGFSKQVMQIITNYSWPGNIRELKNCIEHAVVMSTSPYIEIDDLPDTVRTSSGEKKIILPLDISLKACERTIIQATLDRHEWNKSKVASILEIGRKTLHNKMIEYHISERD